MTFFGALLPRIPILKHRTWINPEVDQALQRRIKSFWLWRALHRRAVGGVYFDGETTTLRLKVTSNGRDFVSVRIDPRTLDFITSPVQPGEIWLSLHYRWLRVDRILWKPDLLSIQCTGDWTTFLNVKRSNRKGLWHLWLPF